MKIRKTYEQRKNYQQFLLSIGGIIALMFLFLFVGLPFILKLTGSIAKFKAEEPNSTNATTIISEPFIDPLPQATNKQSVTVTGSAIEGTTVILYLNQSKYKDTITAKDGSFQISNVPLKTGSNSIYAVSKEENTKSKPSKVITIIYKSKAPELSIESPNDGSSFKRDERTIEIKGLTEEDITVTVNDRFIFVSSNGSFSTSYALSEGENILVFKAVDLAGNETEETITVSYEP